MGALRWSASPPWMTNPRMSIVYAHIWSAPPSLHCMAAGVPCDPTSQVSSSRRAAAGAGAVVTIVSYQMSPQVSTMILRSGVKVTGLDVGDAGSCPHLHTAADIITAPPLVTPSLGPHWSRPGSRDPRQPITAPDEIGVKSWLAVMEIFLQHHYDHRKINKSIWIHAASPVP